MSIQKIPPQDLETLGPGDKNVKKVLVEIPNLIGGTSGSNAYTWIQGNPTNSEIDTWLVAYSQIAKCVCNVNFEEESGVAYTYIIDDYL